MDIDTQARKSILPNMGAGPSVFRTSANRSLIVLTLNYVLIASISTAAIARSPIVGQQPIPPFANQGLPGEDLEKDKDALPPVLQQTVPPPDYEGGGGVGSSHGFLGRLHRGFRKMVRVSHIALPIPRGPIFTGTSPNTNYCDDESTSGERASGARMHSFGWLGHMHGSGHGS